MRRGDWMQTATGRQFWPLDPRSDDICLADIAASLSRQCRFGGHTRGFYSVSEHSVRVCDLAIDQNASLDFVRAALLHDAAEAYCADVIRPLKAALTNYHEIEATIERCVEERFGLPAGIIRNPTIKHWDNVLLATEKRDVMGEPPAPWVELPDPLPAVIYPWPHEKAESVFLDRASYLQLA